MALYLIGDLQGCAPAFNALLQALDFSPSRDHAYLLGDLVNRGPDNLSLLRRLREGQDHFSCILGNHDLHLLSIHLGIKSQKSGDTVSDVLQAPDRNDLMDWLRQQPLARLEHGVLMVHAGVLPQWTAQEAVALSAEVQALLSGPHWAELLRNMYGNEPRQWSADLQGIERRRVIINAFTRLRFCTPDGSMDFDAKAGLTDAPAGHVPWFEVPERRSVDTPIAFGHWSTAGGLSQPNWVNLDTGCVWGGCLSAVELDPSEPARWCDPQRWTQVSCPKPS
jgi:bis(5'-nucleosyl)-tetraphosphatase (symmetrical)